MNIPKYNNKNQNYMANIKKTNEKLTPEQLRDKRAVNCARMLSMDFVNIVPENGDFSPRRFSFDIPDTFNQAVYSLECDPENSKERRIFSIGACRKGSDKLVNYVIYGGTKQEIIDFLADEKNDEKFKKTVKQASDAIDSEFS